MKEHYVVVVTTAPAMHDATLELATRLAARAHAVLLFLHVEPVRPGEGEALLYAGVGDGGRLHTWVHGLRPTDEGVRYRHRLEAGIPEEVVARFVRGHEVDLVVAEEPPRNWLSTALWRGLAERLVQHVDCPVVIGGPGFLRGEPLSAQRVRAPIGADTVGELLNAMVEARVDALGGWMDSCAEAARRIATSRAVCEAAAIAAQSAGLLDGRTERRLHVELEEHRRALRALGWQLRTPHGAWGAEELTRTESPALTAFLARVARQGSSASLPVALDDALDRLVVLAGAHVPAAEGGLLLLAFDAEADFLRILGQPGPLPSFETYAFDERGLMLSNSRFPDHLRAAGLLAAEDLQTPLRLRVAEPSEGPVESWPLTRMARDATRQVDGFDTRGYADYRGIPVVGAWRWVPRYGFGVTAEVDHGVAFG